MIAIIDYNAGNVASVKNALERLGVKSVITSDPDVISSSKSVIFPGQGRAGAAMKELKKRGLDKLIPRLKVPFLGICLGMQLLMDYSEEDKTRCLSIIPGECRKFSSNLKTPHMGWNRVKWRTPEGSIRESSLQDGIPNNSYFYFVHSYFLPITPYALGTTDYGVIFSAVIQKNNFYATQFHPEKSGDAGLRLLRNFCELC